MVVVSQSFAARYWPGEVAVGKRLKRRTYTSSFPWTTVVGVVEDVSSDGVDNAEGVAMYLPHGQTTTAFNRWMTFVVRSDRPLDQLVAELRGRIAAVDADLPLARVATIEQLVSDSLATRRLASGMLGVFALIGLTLLATGTYGVVAFAVAQRRAELGLRRALGARGIGADPAGTAGQRRFAGGRNDYRSGDGSEPIAPRRSHLVAAGGADSVCPCGGDVGRRGIGGLITPGAARGAPRPHP